jgi:hypothetical protein
MKTIALAVAGLASSAVAGVSRLKLQKIPLEQQLVSKSSPSLSATLIVNLSAGSSQHW